MHIILTCDREESTFAKPCAFGWWIRTVRTALDPKETAHRPFL